MEKVWMSEENPETDPVRETPGIDPQNEQSSYHQFPMYVTIGLQ
jgi:hypothetical protein